jgi:hypothetical protein
MLFDGEPLRALTTLSYSANVDLQRSAALAFAEITERRTSYNSFLSGRCSEHYFDIFSYSIF